MGNTIRRQPVEFKIPNSPDYKYLNITDFKGLNITDNPFTGDPESASDLLNVYVDEQNTLTTRPRLQKKFDLKESAIIPEDATIISINYVDDKYLVQYKYNDEVCIFWLMPYNGKYEYTRIEKSSNCSPIGESKIQVVKHKDYYVFVDGVSYKCIENNIVYDASEKAYVPLTKINKSFSDVQQETEYESPNILTGTHKESYGSAETNYKTLDFSMFVGGGKTTITDRFDNKKTFGSVEKEAYLKYIPLQTQTFKGSDVDIIAADATLTKIITAHAGDTKYNISLDSGDSFSTKYFDLHIDGIGISGNGNTVLVVHYVQEDFIQYSISTDGGNSFETKTVGTPSVAGKVGCSISLSYDGKVMFVAKYNKTWFSVDYGNTMSAKTWSQEYTDYYERAYAFVSNDGACLFAYTPPLDTSASYYTKTLIGVLKDNAVTWKTLDNTELPTDVLVTDIPTMGFDYDESIVYVFNSARKGYSAKITDLINIGGQTPWSVVDDTSGITVYHPESYPLVVRGNTGVQGLRDVGGKYCVFPELNFSYDNKLRIELPEKNNHSDDDFNFVMSQDGRSIAMIKNKILYTNFSYPKGYDFLTTTVLSSNDNVSLLSRLNKSIFLKEFNNFLWLGGNENFIIHSAVTDDEKLNDVLYMPVKNKNYLGNDDNEITGFNISSDYDMIAYTRNNLWLISRQEVLEDVYDYVYTETRSDNGHVAKGQTITTPLNEYPLQLNNKGFFVYQAIQNVLTSDKTSVLISDNINAKLLKIPNLENAYFVNHLYWTMMFVPDKTTKKTHVFVLDDRSNSWYYWLFNEKLVSVVNIDDEIELTNEQGRHFTLETSDIINEFNPDITEYYDDGKKLIVWFWKSQVLHLGTMNYSKKLVDTTFIMADTDMSDEYALNYAYTAYRKMLSETAPTTISSKLNYVQSTTKRTLIPRFNFVQLKISNVEDDLDNNKLRLIGLGLKYVLLEGLLR